MNNFYVKSFFTALLLLCTTVVGAHDFEVGGVYYNILSQENKTVEVTNGTNKYTGNVVIPETIMFNDESYSVKSIGYKAFYACADLESIVIPNGVTSIVDYAFYGCSAIKNIELPGSVTSIGDGVFKGCTGIEDAVIGDGIVYIGTSAFSGCSGIKSIAIGDGLINMMDSVFYGCSGITEVEIPSSVMSLGNYTFAYCTDILQVKIPNRVTTIGEGAFYGCSAIADVSIGDNVQTIGRGAFYNCSGIANVEIPNSVTAIGNAAFYNCSAIETLSIGNQVATIGDGVFYNCSGLIDLKIGRAVKTIWNTAFKGCKNIKKIEFDCSTIGSWFDGLQSLEEVVVGENVAKIGFEAFCGCGNLKKVEIKGIPVIEQGAFSRTGLEEAVLPEGITTIPQWCFDNSPNLKRVVIPATVTNIQDYAFEACYNLESIIVSPGNTVFDSRNDCNAIIRTENNTLFLGCKNTIIPEGVTGIGTMAFYKCYDLRNITIPNSVTYIGGYAFVNCNSLENLTIPDGVVDISDYAFWGCSSLKNLEIPQSVRNIGNSTFSNCTALEDITSYIPAESLFVPKSGAFSGIDKARCTLHVPYGAKETYALTEGWNEFENIEEYNNYYKVTFVIDGEEYATATFAESEKVIYPDVPERVGYDFAWENIIDTMPCNDIVISGNYSVKKYLLTYKLDGEVYASDSVEYGSEIILMEQPTKVGHSFSGWSEAPETMPAEDVTVEGSFTINSYTIIYKVNGEVYKIEPMLYGAAINLIEYPVKVGHTFGGWSEAPETMPAENIVIEGSFVIDSYVVTYIVDGEEYASFTVEYGGEIPSANEPVREGHTFNGWSEAPEMMPAEDVTIEGSFTVNSYMVTYLLNGEEYETDIIPYGTKIIPAEVIVEENSSFTGWEMKVPGIYPIDIANNADQMLHSNAYCTNTQYGDQFAGWSVLFDGKSDTFFHSEYGEGTSDDGLDHYLRVDMGEGNKVSLFSFTFTTRNQNSSVNSPKTIVVEGSNESDGEYTEIATIRNIPLENSYVYTSDIIGNEDVTYRYIRYRVTETGYNYKDGNGKIYFFMSEFGMTKYVDYVQIPETMPARDIVVTGSYKVNGYKVVINQYGSATYCSEYALDFSNVKGIKAYTATGYNISTGVVTLTRQQTTQPGIGLFITGEPGEYVVPVLEYSDDCSLNMLVGVLKRTIVNSTSDDGKYYNYKYTVMSGDETPMFYRFKDGSTLSAGKAYLQIPEAWLKTTQLKTISIRFDDSETTDIDEPEGGNGRLNGVYDLQGRRVENPVKGMYIINGKKVLVK